MFPFFIGLFSVFLSSSPKAKFPATAVAEGEATERPFRPETAVATGFEDATPPSPAIAVPLGFACATDESSDRSRPEVRVKLNWLYSNHDIKSPSTDCSCLSSSRDASTFFSDSSGL